MIVIFPFLIIFIMWAISNTEQQNTGSRNDETSIKSSAPSYSTDDVAPTRHIANKPVVSHPLETWSYSAARSAIFNIYKTQDYYGDTIYFSLEVTKATISLQALYSLDEYKKYYTFNPQPLFIVNGVKLVKNENFFNGRDGQKRNMIVDQRPFDGFVRKNSYQVEMRGASILDVTDAMMAGNIAKFDQFYWLGKDKVYPTFSLSGFTTAYNKHFSSVERGVKKQLFSASGLRCHRLRSRKVVILLTDHGTYALNGPAIELYELLDENDVKSNPRRLGRDYIDQPLLGELISKGLKLCD